MTTKEIRPSTAITTCDVCGRTLLRGERVEAYLHGGGRRWVCELCQSRALHEGWIREGAEPAEDGDGSGSERRSLLSRWRARRERERPQPLAPRDRAFPHDDRDEDLTPPSPMRAATGEAPAPVAVRRRRTVVAPPAAAEPRHVRAVPTGVEQKTVAAIELFNASEHPRTVAGVGRSLGLPGVSVLPMASRQSLMTIVVSWELCWYRYEVDLSDEVPVVRPAGQGYELSELSAPERVPNAVATDEGTIEPPG